MLAHTPEAVHAVLEDAFNRGDVEALVRLYEPDATLLAPPDGRVVHGHEAIREAVAPLASLQPQMRSEVVGKVQSNGLAMTHARWHVSGLDGHGNPIELGGRATAVSRKQADGTWRIVLDNPLSPG